MERASGSSTSTTADGLTVDSGRSVQRPVVFECRICMDVPTDPVATACGHVFCWACLYLWLNNRPKPCPVCRSTVRRDINIFPLFGAGHSNDLNQDDGTDAQHETAAAASNCRSVIPPRPRPPLQFIERPPSPAQIHGFDESTEQARNLMTERMLWQLRVNNLELRRIRMRRVALEREGRHLAERNIVARHVQELQRRNSSLLRVAQESRERERRQHVRENQMQQCLMRLQQRLDRANRLLQLQSGNLEYWCNDASSTWL